MALSREQRTARFANLTAENKAAIMRTHAEKWLEKNRGRLSATQAATVQKAVDFVTPALYRQPLARELVEKSDALKGELQCRLRRSDALEAFGPSRSPLPPTGWLDDVWTWFEVCVIG